ncbi:MAG: hypothetical protein EOP84_30055, partial [Verrucomicrobiaceae bacterium]
MKISIQHLLPAAIFAACLYAGQRSSPDKAGWGGNATIAMPDEIRPRRDRTPLTTKKSPHDLKSLKARLARMPGDDGTIAYRLAVM